jgi:hypothetical protein
VATLKKAAKQICFPHTTAFVSLYFVGGTIYVNPWINRGAQKWGNFWVVMSGAHHRSDILMYTPLKQTHTC